MKKLFRKTRLTDRTGKRVAALLLFAVFAVGTILQATVMTRAADITCKELCQAVLRVTGNGDKLSYQSSNVQEFGGFGISDRDKVSSIMYLYDAREAYCVCVAKAAKKSDAKQLLKSLKTYKTNNSNSTYLSDYSSDEQKVFKSAICGKKGKYVWYIAMTTTKSGNKKGQAEIKKLI